MKTPTLLSLSIMLLAGCAGGVDGPPGMIGPGGLEGPSGAPPMAAFISPMGEPYRAPIFEPYPSRQWFAAADTDHDGALSRAEFVADALRFFDSLNVGQDGVLSEADISHYERVLAPEITKTVPDLPLGAMMLGGPPGGGPPGAGMGGMGPGGMGGGPPGGRMGGGMSGPPGGGPPSGGNNPAAALLQMPRGAALFSFLPYPEPILSARRYYGQRITRELFAEVAAERFELLAGGAATLRFETLPTTPVQRFGAAAQRPPARVRP